MTSSFQERKKVFLTDPVTKESEVKIISNIDKKNITIRKFKGIDHRTKNSDPTGSADVVNFRFKHDGSLEKREGVASLASITGTVRAIWTGNIRGAERCFFLASKKIYEIDKNGTVTPIANANTSSGNAEIFFYKGQLYLIDGSGIYCIYQGHLTSPLGYVPLVGNMWYDGQVGDIYQSRNLLSDRGRYSYVMGDTNTRILRFNEAVDSIDAVYVNGELIPDDMYDFVSDSAISVYPLKNYDTVTVAVTYSPKKDTIIDAYGCTQAAVFGGANNSRPFFWGHPSYPAKMYSCGFVSEDDLMQCQLMYPDSDAFYIPQGAEFTVGDGQFPIRAVSRHYDRLLIFTEGGTWMADNADCSFEKHPLININMNVSVISDGAAVSIENHPYCIGKDAIWCWTSDTDELNDCNAYKISEQLCEHLPEGFFTNGRVFADAKRRELLFTSKDTLGTIWVYSLDNKAWSRFTGINVDRFFNFFGNVGFIYSSAISYFFENSFYDVGKEIVAVFESNALNVESPPPWRLSDIDISYSAGGVNVILDTDTTENKLSVKLPISDQYCRKLFRASTGRSNSFKLKVIANGAERQTLHSVGIKVK